MSRDSVEYLYQKSIGRALSSVDDLCRFLDTSVATYKYPLKNQALIHELIRLLNEASGTGTIIRMECIH